MAVAGTQGRPPSRVAGVLYGLGFGGFVDASVGAVGYLARELPAQVPQVLGELA